MDYAGSSYYTFPPPPSTPQQDAGLATLFASDMATAASSSGGAGSSATKRRRDDSRDVTQVVPTTYNGHHANTNNSPSAVWPDQGQNPIFHPPLLNPYHNSAGVTASDYQSTQPPNDHNPQWQPQQQHQVSDTLAFSDANSFAYQPYFFQGDNESNHHWRPPVVGEPSFASHPPEASVVERTDMPYFPTHQPSGPAVEDVGNAAGQQYPAGGQLMPYPQMKMEIDQHPSTQDSTFDFDNGSIHLKMQSLSVLENLATKLIQTMAKASYPQIQDFMQRSETEEGQAYATLKTLFDQTRKVYSRDTPFIDAIAIQMFQPAQQEVIRKANIATFISSILGAHDVSFFHLNEFFMETFVPLGHRLLKWQGAMLLELKTQTYISARINSDGSPEAMLDELFPSDLDAQIFTRHPDAPSLSPSEQDFIDRSRARRSYLSAENSPAAARELPKKYQWSDFVREFASCVNKNVDGLLNLPPRSQAAGNSRDAGTAETALVAGPSNAIAATGSDSQVISGQAGSSSASAGAAAAPSSSASKDRPEGGSGRKSSTTSSIVRQPWTKAEEDALLDGLAKVNGPHWSQILTLYGRGGSTSEVLKDRNQVQLKDKARNLKLWYLKMAKDVPESLKGVTGELRKRGGARARAALNAQEGGEEEGGSGGARDESNADADVDAGAGDDGNTKMDDARPGAKKKGKAKKGG